MVRINVQIQFRRLFGKNKKESTKQFDFQYLLSLIIENTLILLNLFFLGVFFLFFEEYIFFSINKKSNQKKLHYDFFLPIFLFKWRFIISSPLLFKLLPKYPLSNSCFSISFPISLIEIFNSRLCKPISLCSTLILNVELGVV